MYAESKRDLKEIAAFVQNAKALGIDTESTGLNPYARGWQLRTVQVGDRWRSYVVSAEWRGFIKWLMRQEVNWIGHNGPHDIRSIDQYLGFDSGVRCVGETHIPSHHRDSRNRAEGGTGHGLKELAESFIDPQAGKWERALKAEFKQIQVPIPNETYKSGPRKGTQKYRKAKLSEGWSLIDPRHPAYIAYAASDPVLTYRVWQYLQPTVREFHGLYRFDLRVQNACDRLTRRAMRLDVPYTEQLSNDFLEESQARAKIAAQYGCANVQSGQQLAKTLMSLGVRLTERTKTGQAKTDARILREILAKAQANNNEAVAEFVRSVLVSKQLSKRRESYTEQMLEEMDEDGCIHPSINPLAARTARMSVSRPPLQQLPTKDREDELGGTQDELDQE